MEPFTPQGFTQRKLADPYPVYRRYREADPVHQAAPGVWYVFDHEHVAQALSRRDFGRTMPAHLPGRNDNLRRSVENWLVFLDPPRHTRLRRLLAAEFSPGVVAGLRPAITSIASELLRPLLSRRSVELVSEFAAPLPVLVISTLLGVPAYRHGWFRERAERLQEASSARAARNPDAFAAADAAARELTSFFTEQMAQRRIQPRSDLVSLLANAGELTDDEITGTCVHLLTAGHETTTNVLAKTVRTLLARPALADLLRRSPELIPDAVEEFVRHDPPVQMVTRWARKTQTLGGKEIQCGDKVSLMLGSANRDPLRFPDPDEVRFGRDTSRHAGFGMGIHYCLGAHLAKAELEIALPLLLDLVTGRALGDVRYADDMVFHGPARLVLHPSC